VVSPPGGHHEHGSIVREVVTSHSAIRCVNAIPYVAVGLVSIQATPAVPHGDARVVSDVSHPRRLLDRDSRLPSATPTRRRNDRPARNLGLEVSAKTMSTPPLELANASPSVPGAAVDLRMLGGFELCADGVPIDLSAASQRLLALIALHGKPLRRTLVAGVLWPEKPQERANANLRSCLWRLEQPAHTPIVVCHGLTLALDRDVSVDVWRLERVGWAILEVPTTADPNEDPDLFVQPLLPGWYDDWVVMERERLAQLQARFLEGLVTALVAARQFARALDYAIRLVRADPLREQSQLCLLRVYAAEGCWGQISRQVAEYDNLMRDTFGCGVSAAFMSAANRLSQDCPRCLGIQVMDAARQ
jgi:DNA-binding SARP family transcriptional activator